MSFTTEFIVADEDTCKARWACVRDGKAFFCAFCQHQFVPGDEYRMIYSNDLSGYGGNPLTCKPCFDANGGYEGLRNKWKQLWDEYRSKFKWWAIRD